MKNFFKKCFYFYYQGKIQKDPRSEENKQSIFLKNKIKSIHLIWEEARVKK